VGKEQVGTFGEARVRLLGEPDSAAIWLPDGVWAGWGVSEAVEGFVTSLPRMSGTRDDLRQPEKPAYE
jgi:hypothetical protein